jgi:activator of 2-hydroxyglutaryl-CoA dehydratase
MKININQNNIKYILDNGEEREIRMGYEDIHNHSFQVVDHIIDKLYHQVNKTEIIIVYGDNIESKMIVRKLEDKLKREVTINPVSPENNIL